jgi:DNA-binding NarL/FixJ family response regulator
MTRRLFQNLLRLSLVSLILAATSAAPSALHASSAGTKAAAPKSTPETALHRIQRTVARIDAEAKTPEGEAAVLKRLSAQLAASEDSLKLQHEAWGLGYGELAMAYGFARASRMGKTPGDVVAMRTSGSGWLDIAKKLGVKVDTVASRMKRHLGPKNLR